jgi:hypothetical protein
MSRRTLGYGGAAVAALLLPRVAAAIFHIAVIDEVMTSYNGDSTAQFVEIRMLAAGQNFVGNLGGPSFLGVFDSSGAYVGDALTITSDLANDGSDVRWIMATSALATAVGGGFTPDFVIPGPLYLPTAGGMVCWGKPFDHTVPNQYADCVAYGTYSGPLNMWIGTGPTLLTGEGHSLVRTSTVHNSAAAFACGDPATPTNNSIPQMPASLPASAPCPPTPTPTITPTVTPTRTPTVPMYDAVVLPPKPVKVKLRVGVTALTKNIKVAVQNGDDSTTVPIKLQASGCGGLAGMPDFDKNTAGPQDTVVLAAGKSKKAVVPLSITSAAFAAFNEKAPARCVVTFTATADVPGNVDPAPSNDVADLEVTVFDLNDGNGVAAPNHESVTTSLKPLKVKIADGAATASKTVKLKVTNADAGEAAGHLISVSLGAGTCLGVGAPDFDKNTVGVQSTMTVAGNKTASGVVTVTVSRDDFTSSNKKSPGRCTQQLCAAGPMGNVEPNSTNDCTELTIDVIDQNDF